MNRPDHLLLMGLNYTRMFTPTLVNEARLGYTRSPTKITPFDQGTDYNKLLGMSGGPTDPKLFGFPEITIAGYAQLGPAFQQPNSYSANTFDISNTVNWIRGPHLIKFGGDVLRTQYNQLAACGFRAM